MIVAPILQVSKSCQSPHLATFDASTFAYLLFPCHCRERASSVAGAINRGNAFSSLSCLGHSFGCMLVDLSGRAEDGSERRGWRVGWKHITSLVNVFRIPPLELVRTLRRTHQATRRFEAIDSANAA